MNMNDLSSLVSFLHVLLLGLYEMKIVIYTINEILITYMVKIKRKIVLTVNELSTTP
jgi:hypothetical protein